MDLPKILVKLLDTLMVDHMLTSWNILNENNSNITVKIRFSSGHISNQQEDADLKPQSYRRKPPSQIRRDDARFNAYRQKQMSKPQHDCLSTTPHVSSSHSPVTTRAITRSMKQTMDELDIEQDRGTESSPTCNDDFIMDISDITDNPVICTPDVVTQSPDVSPVIPKAAIHYDISTDDLLDTENLVFPSELCDPSDNISANTSHVSITDHCSSSDQHVCVTSTQADIVLPAVITSVSDDSVPDLTSEHSRSNIAFDLHNPDHIQEMLAVLRDAIRETLGTVDHT